MSNCMSSSPFDSDSILKWFTSDESSSSSSLRRDSPSTDAGIFTSPSSSQFAPALAGSVSSGNQGTLSSIPVEVGSEIVQLSVPVDLLCALLLTSGADVRPHYTLQEVVLASENLKRFRDVSSKGHVLGSSNESTAANSTAETPALSSSLPAAAHADVDIISMSLDANGAAIVQEMIAKANDFERQLIFAQLSTTAVLVSVNTHGCRVMQRALECATPELCYTMFKGIPSFKIVDLCMDVNGNHVMQKFVECLPQPALHEMVMIISDSSSAGSHQATSTVARLSLHSYGCRVVQRLLVKCNEEDRSTLLGFILAIFPDLVSDQFGNYVAQHSLDHSNELERKSIISTITLMDVSTMCCNKFASNVVEKAIRSKLVDKTVLHRLVATIIQTEESLLSLMRDKYGNYVVKAICDLNPAEYPEVLYVKNVLLAHSGMLKKFTYGFHLVDKLERGAGGNRSRADSNVSQSSGTDRGGRSRGNSEHTTGGVRTKAGTSSGVRM